MTCFERVRVALAPWLHSIAQGNHCSREGRIAGRLELRARKPHQEPPARRAHSCLRHAKIPSARLQNKFDLPFRTPTSLHLPLKGLSAPDLRSLSTSARRPRQTRVLCDYSFLSLRATTALPARDTESLECPWTEAILGPSWLLEPRNCSSRIQPCR